MSNYRDHLQPLLSGAARSIDLFGAMNTGKTLFCTSEAEALFDDWHSVGRDVEWAIWNFESRRRDDERQLQLFK